MSKLDMNVLPQIAVSLTKTFPNLFTGNFEVIKLEDTASKAGRRMFKVTFKCVEGEPHVGKLHTENYLVGYAVDENDPSKSMQIDPNFFGYEKFVKMLMAAGIEGATKVDELIKLIESTKPRLCLTMKAEQNGEYIQNSISYPVKVGDKPVGEAKVSEKGGKPAGKVASIPCTKCGEMIPANEYGAHFKACTGK